MNTNNFWQTDRGKALIKLFFWMIFIAILIALVIVSERKKGKEMLEIDDSNSDIVEPSNEPEKNDYLSYNTMLNNLLANNYEYKYIIKSDNANIIFTGFKNPDKELGFKETESEIVKYYIDSTGSYQLNMDVPTMTDSLYKDLDSSYLDLNLLFNNLSEYLYTVEENTDNRKIIYNKDGFQVTVTTDTANIKNILITTQTTTYDLNFKNIGECATIDFVLS